MLHEILIFLHKRSVEFSHIFAAVFQEVNNATFLPFYTNYFILIGQFNKFIVNETIEAAKIIYI